MGWRQFLDAAEKPGHGSNDPKLNVQAAINKPVFVVGSPRSGTSILTWCLGQHPNLIPLPESNWMGDFAFNLAISYQIGTGRGNQSVLSAMEIQDDEFFASFGNSVNQLIQEHRECLQRKLTENFRNYIERQFPADTPSDKAARMSAPAIPHSAAGPKTRWVDQTPEYSFHICGLRKLFPSALFIHILRDVTSVVRSMLNFHRLAGIPLVANEQEAYNYWLRAVSSCLLAERAYGPGVVLRVRHADLVSKPESTLRSVLDFLSEPFASECLTLLRAPINSSNVPAGFKLGDPATDATLVEKATQISRQLEETPQPTEGSPDAAAEMEAAFQERVQYLATVDTAYQRAQSMIQTLKDSG
jgi:hypothetical protein